MSAPSHAENVLKAVECTTAVAPAVVASEAADTAADVEAMAPTRAPANALLAACLLMPNADRLLEMELQECWLVPCPSWKQATHHALLRPGWECCDHCMMWTTSHGTATHRGPKDKRHGGNGDPVCHFWRLRSRSI
jgi:hypothetical protein